MHANVQLARGHCEWRLGSTFLRNGTCDVNLRAVYTGERQVELSVVHVAMEGLVNCICSVQDTRRRIGVTSQWRV